MADQHLCVAIYKTHDQANEALSRLRVEGSDMTLLSCVARGYWIDMIGSRNAGERFHYRGINGPFWEQLWATMPGWGVFWFFPDGPVMVAGPLVRTIVATQEEGDGHGNGHGNGSGDGNANGFEVSLSGIGIPDDSLVLYKQAVLDDHVLIFIHGAMSEIDRVQDILNQTKAVNHTIHHGI